MEKQICVLCGEKHNISDMLVLGVMKGMAGRDLGYVCKECIEHIDNMEYFKRIKENEDD